MIYKLTPHQEHIASFQIGAFSWPVLIRKLGMKRRRIELANSEAIDMADATRALLDNGDNNQSLAHYEITEKFADFAEFAEQSGGFTIESQ